MLNDKVLLISVLMEKEEFKQEGIELYRNEL
jgi:hypothetical protein